MFRTDGKILRDFLCIGRQVLNTTTLASPFKTLSLSKMSPSGGEQVAVLPCEPHARWTYDSASLLLTYQETGTCLAIKRLQGAPDTLVLETCDQGERLQHWHVTHYNPGGLEYADLA